MTDEPYVDAVGDAALGTITASIYSTQHNSAVNKEFVKEYYELNGTKPRIGIVGVASWDALRLTYDALNAQAGGKFDPDKFVAFVHGRSFESPRGPVTIDRSNGDIIQNVYIRQDREGERRPSEYRDRDHRERQLQVSRRCGRHGSRSMASIVTLLFNGIAYGFLC